jgi:hemerythrin superfamily protein
MKTKKPTSKRPSNSTRSPKSKPRSAAPQATAERFIAAVKGLIARATKDDSPKATDLLESHHRVVEKLFDAIESANGNAKALVHELATNLLAHMIIEEKLFYPAARAVDEPLVLEGYEEHFVSRFALERLLDASPKDKTFKAKMKTLKDIIADHVKEEEHELFPRFEKSMSAEAQRTLGAKMKRMFDATVAGGWEKALKSEGPKVPAQARRANALASANGHAG